MTTPLVSVLIDSYNYGHFIEEAIDSVLSQDFPMDQMEIVVVDDGSTDGTGERVRKKYGQRVRYFYQENGGPASAFNLGFRQAQGEVVALLDADDYFLPGKLRLLVKEFEIHPDAGMVYHARMELLAKTGELREAQFEEVSGFLPADRAKLMKYAIQPTSCLAFRRRLVEQVLPIPEAIRLQADTYPGLLMALIAPVIAVREPLCVYRIHGQNLFYGDEKALGAEKAKQRLGMFSVVIREAEVWVEQHKDRLKAREARLLLDRFSLRYTEMGFEVEPPSRWRYFWFLWRQNTTHRSQQTWKFTLFNYAAAFAGLLLGYPKGLAWRERQLPVSLRRLRKLVGAREKQRC